jgi:hypothetical protein
MDSVREVILQTKIEDFLKVPQPEFGVFFKQHPAEISVLHCLKGRLLIAWNRL